MKKIFKSKKSEGLPNGPNYVNTTSEGFIISERGQWDYPGQKTLIPSNNITMKGVPYPVFGTDDTGYSQMMYPGAEYTFPGSMVYETPMMQSGGTFNPETDEFIGFVDELPKAQTGFEKDGDKRKFVRIKDQTGKISKMNILDPDYAEIYPNLTIENQDGMLTRTLKPIEIYPGQYETLESLYNEASNNYYDQISNLDRWPTFSGKTINLSTDRYRGANVPVEYIDMLRDSAKRFNIDPYILYAIAGRESTFGQQKNSPAMDIRNSSPITLVSGWNITEPYEPYSFDRFLADNKTPNVTVEKNNDGYYYNINDTKIDEINDYIDKNKLIDKYKTKLENTKKINYNNPFDFLAEFIINNGIEKYNPGDPDYKNKIDNEIRILKSDPEFSKYVNRKLKGGLVKAQNGKENKIPKTALTYNDNRAYFDSHAVLHDNPKYNEWVKKNIYEGKIAYDPTTGISYPLDKKVSVPEGIAEMATEKYAKKPVDERIRTNKAARKNQVVHSMTDIGDNPLFYSPGVIAAGAAGIAGGVGPMMTNALQASLPGMSTIPGATYGNLLGSIGAVDAMTNRLPQVPSQLSRGEYADAAANLLTGGLDLYGANMISPLSKGAGTLFREQVYNAIDPVGYGVRSKIINAPYTWAKNTFNPKERALRIGKNFSNDDAIAEELGKNRLDAWRLGLNLDQRYGTFQPVGNNTYRISKMSPHPFLTNDLYTDILAHEINKRGYSIGDDALKNINLRNYLAKLKKGTAPGYVEEHIKRGLFLPDEPWKQTRIVENAKNQNFTHSIYDADTQGIMGSYRWDVKKLDDGNLHFQSNDTWNINPWENRGQINLSNNTYSPGYRKWNPFSNVEFLGLVGGKPFDIQNNFIIDPKTYEIIQSYDKGGAKDDDKKKYKFRKKTQYDPRTDEIVEYYATDGNEYYKTSDTPKDIAFERYLDPIEIKYKRTLADRAKEFLRNFKPASGRAEPTFGPIEAALFAPAAAAMASTAIPAAASALELPAVVGEKTIIPWLTGNNILGLTGGLAGGYNLGQDINTGYYNDPNISTEEKLARGLETGLFLSGSPGVISGLGMGLNKLNQVGKNVANTPKLSLAFQSPAERLVNPEAYRVLTGKSSGIRGNILESYYNLKQKNILKAQTKLRKKVYSARRSNQDDLAESFLEKIDILDNDYDKLSKLKNDWQLKYSGLPITRTNMGGGQGRIFKNNLNENELIKVGSYFGNEQSLNNLIELGKTYNNPNVAAAFPTKAIPFTKGVESSGLVGESINAAQFMPKLNYNSGLYSASKVMTPEQIKLYLNELNQLGIGIDYTSGAGNIGRVGNKLGLVDLTYVGPAGKRTTNYFDREGIFNPRFINDEVLGRFRYDVDDWLKPKAKGGAINSYMYYADGGTYNPNTDEFLGFID